jgi:hypothetical protein
VLLFRPVVPPLFTSFSFYLVLLSPCLQATLKAKVESLQRSLQEKETTSFGQDKTLGDAVAARSRAEAEAAKAKQESNWLRAEVKAQGEKAQQLEAEKARQLAVMKELGQVRSLIIGARAIASRSLCPLSLSSSSLLSFVVLSLPCRRAPSASQLLPQPSPPLPPSMEVLV